MVQLASSVEGVDGNFMVIATDDVSAHRLHNTLGNQNTRYEHSVDQADIIGVIQQDRSPSSV